jgi:hypothetical protein
MNSIVTNVRPPVQASLFVDDFANYCASANINVIERQLQLVLNRLYSWSCRNGFTFSPSKTCCIHFCRKHQLHAYPVLYLGNIPIYFVESNKFLGLHFDGSLTWKKHVTQLRVESTKALDFLRILSGSPWVADSLPFLLIPCSCQVCFGLWQHSIRLGGPLIPQITSCHPPRWHTSLHRSLLNHPH